MVTQRADLTFKHNIHQGRHGWLRLTPAYSINAVMNFLDQNQKSGRVLDPFSGTGTTGLLCAELGINSTLVELNPFLVWLAQVKTRSYSAIQLAAAKETTAAISHTAQTQPVQDAWTPPIHEINRWWEPHRLVILAQIFEEIKKVPDVAVRDLLQVAFCRLAIEWSNAAFNHQSMSFKKPAQTPLMPFDEHVLLLDSFRRLANDIITSAAISLVKPTRIIEGDSRQISDLTNDTYTQVITSPPYPNRMSYIRELRPYMYWLGYLSEAKEAGELDWKAIGGTWGIATSRLLQWKPDGITVQYEGFYQLLDAIATSPQTHSQTLANYVHKYFMDMVIHFSSLRDVLEPGAEIVYIVGNSTFYNVTIPVEQIFASIMQQCGFVHTRTDVLRKRNSKKELFEYAVIGRFPG